ncbi:GerAB/ArcD/ProY family transporter [Brevibacillus borstelensis]|uniref:GerAB/ArcD/ProY family transporter n=1 Tax=Brevibacillus borstelensis TaxID=45462 RepID=UPI001D0B8AF7|nr:endospore germination permease [Brevibacillus borstelensis]MCC0565552.1 spore germination protein [Brevibacillus borstelensis]MCM3468869.1 spore germination protein [Brevibacillus borstelensis]MCM3621543.1 spore germination protein [Brevibacillus borstelensis]
MNTLPYADQKIGQKEMVFIVANVVIGVGILTFPRTLAAKTGSIDGWISILISGLVASVIGWLLGKLASRFPANSFFEYASLIVSRPVAQVITFLVGIYFLLFVSFEARARGNIAKQYLFTTTPVEVITLAFLLIVQYAVAGTRIALLRLNMLFFPIVLLISAVVQLYSIQMLELDNVRPLFTTGLGALLQGSKEVNLSFSGYEVVLFYTLLMTRAEDAPKAVVKGLLIPIFLYLTIYIFVIGVFSAEVVKNLTYPTIELAKDVEVPGGFIERVESLFFTIWIMTIFNSCTVFFDLAIFNLGSIFPNVRKFTWLLIISPLVYMISLWPQNLVQFFSLGDQLVYFGIFITYLVPILLLLIAKWRGVRGDE